MLTLMNELATYLKTKWNRKAYIKVHCSTGQFCTNHTDPRTGQPLNFNFLPIFADESLGIMPHTVQAYTFEDPAPVYGNQDFGYMRVHHYIIASYREPEECGTAHLMILLIRISYTGKHKPQSVMLSIMVKATTGLVLILVCHTPYIESCPLTSFTNLIDFICVV
jgi:hypothetical protein